MDFESLSGEVYEARPMLTGPVMSCTTGSNSCSMAGNLAMRRILKNGIDEQMNSSFGTMVSFEPMQEYLLS